MEPDELHRLSLDLQQLVADFRLRDPTSPVLTLLHAQVALVQERLCDTIEAIQRDTPHLLTIAAFLAVDLFTQAVQETLAPSIHTNLLALRQTLQDRPGTPAAELPPLMLPPYPPRHQG